VSLLPGSPVGPLWREMLVSRAFFYIILRVPSKGAVPPGSLIELPQRERERGGSISRALLHPSHKVPGKWAHSRLPSCAPMKRGARLQSLPLHIVNGPQ